MSCPIGINCLHLGSDSPLFCHRLYRGPCCNLRFRIIKTACWASDLVRYYPFLLWTCVLIQAAHLFYAEIQFDSLLIYFKCEGTFTESKISTGTSIHDSTRSENTLVRTSITSWGIVSGIVSTCGYAQPGTFKVYSRNAPCRAIPGLHS